MATVGHRKRILTKVMHLQGPSPSLKRRKIESPVSLSSPEDSLEDSSSSTASGGSSKGKKDKKDKKDKKSSNNLVPLLLHVGEQKRLLKMKRNSSGRMGGKEDRHGRDRRATLGEGVPKLSSLSIEFQVIDSGDFITIPLDGTQHTVLPDLVNQVWKALNRPDLDPLSEVALMIPTDVGPVVLFEQSQLDAIVNKTIASGVHVAHLLVSLGRSTVSCNAMSPRSNFTLREVQERVSFRRYPCLLVEAETNSA